MKFEELFTRQDNYLSLLPNELKIALIQFLVASSLNTETLAKATLPTGLNDESGKTVIAFQPGLLPPAVTLEQLQEWAEVTGPRLQEHQFFSDLTHSNCFKKCFDHFRNCHPSYFCFVSIPLFVLFGAAINFAYHYFHAGLKMLISALVILTLGALIVAGYFAIKKLKWKSQQTEENLKSVVQAGKEKYGFLQTLSKWNDVDPEIAVPLKAYAQIKKSATEATPLLRIEHTL